MKNSRHVRLSNLCFLSLSTDLFHIKPKSLHPNDYEAISSDCPEIWLTPIPQSIQIEVASLTLLSVKKYLQSTHSFLLIYVYTHKYIYSIENLMFVYTHFVSAHMYFVGFDQKVPAIIIYFKQINVLFIIFDSVVESVSRIVVCRIPHEIKIPRPGNTSNLLP